MLFESKASTIAESARVFVLGSISLAGCFTDAVTGVSEVTTVNVGFPFCENPCKLLLSALFTVGSTVGFITSGIYSPSIVFKTSLTFGVIASSLVPQSVVVLFVSLRRIVIPCAFPTKPFAGVNSTSTSFPFGVNLYVPCPITVYVFSSDKVIGFLVLLLI